MTRDLQNSFRRMMGGLEPEVDGPVLARVIEQHKEAGRYTVHVEKLLADGEPDPDWPTIEDVEVPRGLFTGGTTGAFCAIGEGTICRVGFYENDPHRPYLDAVIGGFSSSSPDISGQMLVVDLSSAKVTVSESGEATVEAGKVVIQAPAIFLGDGKATEPVLLGMTAFQWLNAHTHTSPVGPTSVPNNPLTPDALSVTTKVK